MPTLIDPSKKQPVQAKRGERMSPTGDVFWNPNNGQAERGADNRLRSTSPLRPDDPDKAKSRGRAR